MVSHEHKVKNELRYKSHVTKEIGSHHSKSAKETVNESVSDDDHRKWHKGVIEAATDFVQKLPSQVNIVLFTRSWVSFPFSPCLSLTFALFPLSDLETDPRHRSRGRHSRSNSVSSSDSEREADNNHNDGQHQHSAGGDGNNSKGKKASYVDVTTCRLWSTDLFFLCRGSKNIPGVVAGMLTGVVLEKVYEHYHDKHKDKKGEASHKSDEG